MARRARLSHARIVRLFRRVALQRFEEAQFLLVRGHYSTAAVYMAGYAVECILKALILSNETAAKHQATLQSFRGTKAHDFDWLKLELSRRKVSLPAFIARRLSDVNTWTTALRYEPATIPVKIADNFLRAAEEILHWGKERL
jgi:HEPN domain-containing protein